VQGSGTLRRRQPTPSPACAAAAVGLTMPHNVNMPTTTTLVWLLPAAPLYISAAVAHPTTPAQGAAVRCAVAAGLPAMARSGRLLILKRLHAARQVG
jgi:hypothetical protein